MNRSLQRHLSLMLALAILVIGVAASLVSFYFAYAEAEEFQDDALRLIAAMSAGNAVDTKLLDSANRSVSDAESRVQIIRLPHDAPPAWLPADITDGFHTLDASANRMRVFVRDAPHGGRIAIAQLTDARDEIARDSALRTLIPLLLLLPILVGLVVVIVRRELAGIRQLSASLDTQSAERPQPLSELDLPEEIAPFVQAINRLLARVNRMVDGQRRFIADAAHELRSPLTALSLQVQNLESTASLDAMRERVVPLKTGIQRARHLTEQLLSLARTQASVVTIEKIDLSKLARELIADYLPLAEAKGIDLGLEEDCSIYLTSELGPLRLILKNALDNAIRYAPKNGNVTLRLAKDEDGVVIEVLDSGPGIPASEQQSVFDPFYRLADTPGEGSGLGLAIVRDAAARLGGAVSLEPRQGVGTVFRYRQDI